MRQKNEDLKVYFKNVSRVLVRCDNGNGASQ